MTKTIIATQAVRVGLSALATIALFSAAPAAASEQVQERVYYHDLDLTNAAGQATLDQRIRAAVKRVCPGPNSSSLNEFTAWSRCKRDSLAGAQTQMKFAIARAGSSKSGIAAMTLARSPVGKR